jgi:hypothetical protein
MISITCAKPLPIRWTMREANRNCCARSFAARGLSYNCYFRYAKVTRLE